MIREARAWIVIALLVAVDHIFKFAFNHLIPLRESVPVVANRLHLANFHNIHGNLLSAELGASPQVMQTLVVSVLYLALAPLFFRFYSERYRISFWSVLAFCCLVAGCASGAIDLGARGFVIDYLYLPGLFAADLKGVYLTMAFVTPCAGAQALPNTFAVEPNVRFPERYVGGHTFE